MTRAVVILASGSSGRRAFARSLRPILESTNHLNADLTSHAAAVEFSPLLIRLQSYGQRKRQRPSGEHLLAGTDLDPRFIVTRSRTF